MTLWQRLRPRTTPGKGVAHFRRGLAHAKRGEWQAAARSYEAALAEDGKVADWHYRLGVALGQLNEWDRAAAAYENALAGDDSKAAWHYRLGAARAKLNDFAAAAQAYEAAIARDEGNPIWRLRLGLARMKQRDWGAAAAALSAAIARDGRRANWHYYLGAVSEKMGDWPAAAEAYEAALALDDSKPHLHFRLAAARTKSGEWTGAAHAYRAALARNASNAEWHFRLGMVLAKAGDWTGAAAAYEAALARDDTRADWHFRLAVARARLAEWGVAARACEAAIARDDSRANWHACLGSFRARLKDWRAMAAAYAAAIAREADNAEWLFCRGVAQEKLRDWAGAVASYDAAVARNKNQPKYLRQRQSLRAKMQEKSALVKGIQLALSRDPNDELARYKAGVDLAKRGHDTEALTLLAPTVSKSDAILESFLPPHLRPPATDRKVLFVRGAGTTLARKIEVGAKPNPAVYFEHTRRPIDGAECVRNFYALVSDGFGKAPTFVPRLHFSQLSDGYGYFLFDYLERDAALEARFFDSTTELDRDLALRVVDGLAEISKLRYASAGGGVPNCASQGLLFAADVTRAERYAESELGKSHSDDNYNCFLKALSENWATYQRRLNEAHQVFSHGNAQKSNAVIAKNGELYLVDGESYGSGPIGIDFVALFSNRMGTPQFEELAERYFRAIAPRIGSRERTAILALLSTIIAVVGGLPIPPKWLHRLTSR